MKRLLILALALLLALPAVAQVGRYKNIKLMYPGYSLKLDTATGELTAVHYDNDSDQYVEEVILERQSRHSHQIGRYEFRRTRRLGVYEIFDTSTGNYTTVKWRPTDSAGKEIEADLDTAFTTAVDGLRRFLKGLEESLDMGPRETVEVSI